MTATFDPLVCDGYVARVSAEAAESSHTRHDERLAFVVERPTEFVREITERVTRPTPHEGFRQEPNDGIESNEAVRSI